MGLTGYRAQVVEALSGPYGDVLPYVPENWAPPLIMLTTGDPYLEEGDTFNPAEMQVNLEVILVAAPQENSAITPVMDEMITHAVLHVVGGEVVVSAPFMVTNERTNYLACRVSISQIITLEGA